jgi:hypothetical protein
MRGQLPHPFVVDHEHAIGHVASPVRLRQREKALCLLS